MHSKFTELFIILNPSPPYPFFPKKLENSHPAKPWCGKFKIMNIYCKFTVHVTIVASLVSRIAEEVFITRKQTSTSPSFRRMRIFKLYGVRGVRIMKNTVNLLACYDCGKFGQPNSRGGIYNTQVDTYITKVQQDENSQAFLGKKDKEVRGLKL